MKKYFYLIATAAVLANNPLMAMDDPNFFDYLPDFSIKAAQLSKWVNDPARKGILDGSLVKIQDGYPDGNEFGFGLLALKDGYYDVKLQGGVYQYLPSNNSEEVYLRRAAFLSTRLSETKDTLKNNPGMKIDPDEDIHFSWYARGQNFIAPFPGWERGWRDSNECRFYGVLCQIFFQTEEKFLQDERKREENRRAYENRTGRN